MLSMKAAIAKMEKAAERASCLLTVPDNSSSREIVAVDIFAMQHLSQSVAASTLGRGAGEGLCLEVMFKESIQ